MKYVPVLSQNHISPCLVGRTTRQQTRSAVLVDVVVVKWSFELWIVFRIAGSDDDAAAAAMFFCNVTNLLAIELN